MHDDIMRAYDTDSSSGSTIDYPHSNDPPLPERDCTVTPKVKLYTQQYLTATCYCLTTKYSARTGEDGEPTIHMLFVRAQTCLAMEGSQAVWNIEHCI